MEIKVKVVCNSRKRKIERQKEKYIARLKSAPLKGKANKELIELLGDYFNHPKSEIEIKRGFKDRVKIVRINPFTNSV